MTTDTRRSSWHDKPCRRPVATAKPPARLGDRPAIRRPLPTTVSRPSLRGLGRPSDESARGAHEHRRADGFWWKIPHANGLMHDRLVPAGRFFSTASGAAGGANCGPIHAPQFFADGARVEVRSAQPLECSVQRTVGVPLIEQPPGRLPLAELVGQVTPRRTGPQNPQDAVENHATIDRWTTRRCRLPKQVRNAIPLVVRKQLSSHVRALLGEKDDGSKFDRNDVVMKWQF